jgi:hypothetical protein
MPTMTKQPLFDQLDTWLTEVDNVKTAAAKPATKPAPAKPAKTASTKTAGPSGMGKTTHPSDDVDDNTQAEETGARFEENKEDVKKDIQGYNVEKVEGEGCSQEEQQMQIGTVQSETGGQPSVEDDYKSDKDDPGTTHPADAESTGEKYSSLSMDKLLKLAEESAHDILADLANGIGQIPAGKTVTETAAAVKTATQQAKPNDAKKAADAGYDAAQLSATQEKVAAEYIEQTIRDAELDADLVGSFLHSYQQTLTKKAAGEDGETHEPKEEEEAPAEGGGEGAPAGGGGSDVLAALGAGGGGGGGGAPPGAMPGGDIGGAGGGAMPPGAMPGGMGGGDPAAAGGMPPGAGGDMGGGAGGAGGVSHEQALQELAMALEELGIPIEALPQLVAQHAQSAGTPDVAGEGQKLASAVKDFKKSGKFRFREAKTAAQETTREQIKDYVREICGMK